MFLNGKNSESVLYGKDFFIIIFNLLLFTALNSPWHKIGGKSRSLILAYDFFFISTSSDV